VCAAEMPRGSAEADRGFGHDGRRLESFLHLLATEEMAPLSEGTVERFWSLGENGPRGLKSSARGRSWTSDEGADAPVPRDDMRRQRSERIS
jgi:hypothetical protein